MHYRVHVRIGRPFTDSEVATVNGREGVDAGNDPVDGRGFVKADVVAGAPGDAGVDVGDWIRAAIGEGHIIDIRITAVSGPGAPTA